jgi:hypothetical protein
MDTAKYQGISVLIAMWPKYKHPHADRHTYLLLLLLWPYLAVGGEEKQSVSGQTRVKELI